eukprot:11183364-Lingulodinium_polyedra.AAC.1
MCDDRAPHNPRRRSTQSLRSTECMPLALLPACCRSILWWGPGPCRVILKLFPEIALTLHECELAWTRSI